MTRTQFEADFSGVPDSEAPSTITIKKRATDLPDPSKFVGIPGPASARKKGSISEKIQGAVDSQILTVKKATETILNSWAAHNDKLYEKGSFMTRKEKEAFLKDVQNDPALAYSIMGGTTGQNPPKTIDEALSRMGYLLSESILGGARDVTRPFSSEAGKPRRPEDSILQLFGVLLIPSPQDYFISTAFRAFASGGKEGIGILRKVLKGTPLVADEMIQFEKLVGSFGTSTHDLRKTGIKFSKLSDADWIKLMKKYEKLDDLWKTNADLYTAGGAYRPKAIVQLKKMLYDVGYDSPGEYINFLTENKIGATLDYATIAAFLIGLKPPTPDLDAFDKIGPDLDKFMEYQEKLLEAEKKKPVIKDPITLVEPVVTDPTKPDDDLSSQEEEEKEEEEIKPDVIPDEDVIPVEEVIPEEEIIPEEEEEEEGVIPDEVIPEEVIPEKVVPEEVIPEEVIPEEVIPEDVIPDKPVPDKPVPDEPAPVEPPLPKPRRRKDGGLPPNIFRALVGGKNEEYRIVFDYPKGKQESFRVKARSFPQALSQAQQRRRLRQVPSEVDIVKTRVKK